MDLLDPAFEGIQEGRKGVHGDQLARAFSLTLGSGGRNDAVTQFLLPLRPRQWRGEGDPIGVAICGIVEKYFWASFRPVGVHLRPSLLSRLIFFSTSTSISRRSSGVA